MQLRYKLNGQDVSAEEFQRANDPTRLEEMLASGQPPMSKTDRELLEGHRNGSQFEKTPGLGDYYQQVAKRQGVDVKGKVYLSGLAAYPGDPKAWVADRGDVKRVVEERGWGCEGMVDVKLTEVAQPTGGGVAPDIVENKVLDILEESPEPIKDVQALREQVAEQLKPYWAK